MQLIKLISTSVTFFPIQISDALSELNPNSPYWKFRSLEYSIFICPFVGVLGGLFFLLTALYVKEDRKAAERMMTGDNRFYDISECIYCLAIILQCKALWLALCHLGGSRLSGQDPTRFLRGGGLWVVVEFEGCLGCFACLKLRLNYMESPHSTTYAGQLLYILQYCFILILILKWLHRVCEAFSTLDDV